MTATGTSRRYLLGASALACLSFAAGAAPAGAAWPAANSFEFEVQRSEAEWRKRLGPAAYAVLREGKTEFPTTSPLWNDYRAGVFDCRGCDLRIYQSEHRAPIDKGWVFFFHSQPNAVLTGIDTGDPYRMAEGPAEALIEVHCRRCGSHLGHLLTVEGALVHCINGISLSFSPEEASMSEH